MQLSPFGVYWMETPILKVQHPALTRETELAADPEWRERLVADSLGMRYADWWAQERALKVDQVTEYVIRGRVEILQQWEREQETKRDAGRNRKGRTNRRSPRKPSRRR